MTVGQLISVLKGADPKARVFAEVTAQNKSVQGIHIDPDGDRTRVTLK